MTNQVVAAISLSGFFNELGPQVVASMKRLHIPGVAVGIAHGDDQHAAGFGVTNADHLLAVDADTLF